jgi:hypothetical protein
MTLTLPCPSGGAAATRRDVAVEWGHHWRTSRYYICANQMVVVGGGEPHHEGAPFYGTLHKRNGFAYGHPR